MGGFEAVAWGNMSWKAQSFTKKSALSHSQLASLELDEASLNFGVVGCNDLRIITSIPLKAPHY